MAAIVFPTNPGGQTPVNTFSPTSTPSANTTNSFTYVWNGSVWTSTSSGGGGGGTVTGVTASAPLASSGGAAPNLSLTGSVPVANGGTGATTQAGAQANLLPAQTAPDAGKFLTTDGAGVVSWATASGGVTSFAGGTTGLTPAAATTGAIALAGTLAVTNGGTGGTTAAAAQSNLLPAQAGNAGKFLTTDGAGVVSWATAGGSTTPFGVGTTVLAASQTGVNPTPGSNLLLTYVGVSGSPQSPAVAVVSSVGNAGVGSWAFAPGGTFVAQAYLTSTFLRIA